MKKLILFLLLLSTKSFAFQSDTTIVEYNDNVFNKKIKVKSDKSTTFIYPKVLNINHVLKAFQVDSLERNRVWVLLENSKRSSDTVMVVNRTGNNITITTRNFSANSNSGRDEIISYESNDKKDFDIQINSDQNGPKSKYTSRYFKRSNFDLYLGLNSYTNQQDAGPYNQSDLRIWPSRYIALSFKKNINLANTENTHLVLSVGPEFAWHNFMLKNSNKLLYENGQAMFVENTERTTKSKFVVPHLNLPVMLNIGLKKEKVHLGIGGYIGYRTGGYTKEKFADDKNKEFIKGQSLGLNNLKYGLTAELGRKYGSALFIRYDLSNLFRDNQIHVGDMQAFSFGIKL